MDIHGTRYCTIRLRASNTVSLPYRMIRANGFTVLYDLGTIRDFIRYAYSYRERHRAASADTKIGFVRYDYERDVRLI